LELKAGHVRLGTSRCWGHAQNHIFRRKVVYQQAVGPEEEEKIDLIFSAATPSSILIRRAGSGKSRFQSIPKKMEQKGKRGWSENGEKRNLRTEETRDLGAEKKSEGAKRLRCGRRRLHPRHGPFDQKLRERRKKSREEMRGKKD